MTTFARYHPRGIDINLVGMPRWLYDEIVSWRGHIHSSDKLPVFTCLGNHAPMFVYQNHKGRYFLSHFRNHGCGESHALTTMSDEHRRQAEYAARAAQAAGLQADLEVSTGGGTRLDVGIIGAQQVGFEIQRSELSRAHAKSRATKSFKAGWPTAWIHDRADDPDWAGHVPTARFSVRSIWEDSMPPKNTAKVRIHRVWRERDREKRSGWRYEYGPTEVLFDELAVLMPAGEIETVPVGKHGIVLLAHRGAAEIVESCTYRGGAVWQPTAATPQTKEAAQEISRPCRNPHSDELAKFFSVWSPVYRMSPVPTAVPKPVVPKPVVPKPQSRNCPGCALMHTVAPCFPECWLTPDERDLLHWAATADGSFHYWLRDGHDAPL